MITHTTRLDTPGAIAQRAVAATYRVTNGYTGEVFEGLDGYDVGELLWKWLAEDGYEFDEHEQWHDYRWRTFSDGYIVEEIEDESEG